MQELTRAGRESLQEEWQWHTLEENGSVYERLDAGVSHRGQGFPRPAGLSTPRPLALQSDHVGRETGEQGGREGEEVEKTTPRLPALRSTDGSADVERREVWREGGSGKGKDSDRDGEGVGSGASEMAFKGIEGVQLRVVNRESAVLKGPERQEGGGGEFVGLEEEAEAARVGKVLENVCQVRS